jgi:hypothetical protein
MLLPDGGEKLGELNIGRNNGMRPYDFLSLDVKERMAVLNMVPRMKPIPR